jgi:hypothetical protein
MEKKNRFVTSLLLGAALSVSAIGTACAEHHYYRVYDVDHGDYHVWNDNEIVYYRQWAGETHRDADRDFRKLRPEEQKEYWNWRHSHSDHDKDKDHH